jgi:hypothetical protein
MTCIPFDYNKHCFSSESTSKYTKSPVLLHRWRLAQLVPSVSARLIRSKVRVSLSTYEHESVLLADAGHLYQYLKKSSTDSMSWATPNDNPNSLHSVTVRAVSSANPRPQECQILSTLPFLSRRRTLNPPTVSQNYRLDDGLDEGQDINLPRRN